MISLELAYFLLYSNQTLTHDIEVQLRYYWNRHSTFTCKEREHLAIVLMLQNSYDILNTCGDHEELRTLVSTPYV